MYTVRVSRTFSAAHAIKGMGSKCEAVHGHNYRVEVAVGSEELRPPGMVADFLEIGRHLDDLLPDHTMLNEVYKFNSTSENLAYHFYEEMSKHYPVKSVTVWEDENCCAEYSG